MSLEEEVKVIALIVQGWALVWTHRAEVSAIATEYILYVTTIHSTDYTGRIHLVMEVDVPCWCFLPVTFYYFAINECVA